MGHATLAGGHPAMKKPVSGLLASDLAVGSSVYLMENGAAVEYLVVNQGIPSDSTLYDESCNGMWLLRKDIYEDRQWHSSNVNDYANSTIHSYLNSTFLALFDAETQVQIKQVKLPYRPGSGTATTVNSGANGLSSKIFLLSGPEVSLTNSYMVAGEGAILSYFNGCATTAADSKRIAYLNGSANHWRLRSPHTSGTTHAWLVSSLGGYTNSNCSNSNGIRPALVLPSNAIFDTDTLLFKGVS